MEAHGIILVFHALSPEEDTRRYRNFMKSVLFLNATDAIRKVETDADGLTPAEVWEEVDKQIAYLRTISPPNRKFVVGQIVTNLGRSLRTISRDGNTVARSRSDVDRSITCILYCLALRLEAASKRPSDNPHNDLINALVDELNDINHESLPVLHTLIECRGEENEKRNYLVEEEDPMPMEADGKTTVRRVIDHYCARVDSYLAPRRVDAFNRFWTMFQEDEALCNLLLQPVSVKGGECEELGVRYNCKMIFNVYGMLLDKGFFAGIRGRKPLSEIVSGHYDKNTGNLVVAKSDYFNYLSTTDSFIGVDHAALDSIKRTINHALE